MNTKNNHRYQDMDIFMKAAMLELMQTTPFEKITVKSVCQKAGVNRGTFYYHYTDMNGMLTQLEEYLTEELLQRVEEFRQREDCGSLFLPYLDYINEHKYAYKVILSSQNILPIKKGFRPLFEYFILPQCQTYKITDENEITYYNIYFQSGITMVLRHWIENGCEKSRKDMNRILINCIPAIR